MAGRGGRRKERRKIRCTTLVLDVYRINEINRRGLNVRVYIYKIEDSNLVPCSFS